MIFGGIWPAGRYMLEHGIYPPTDTFTFSPVNPTTPNTATWVGDIVLYIIYAYLGKDVGLQLFRIVAILIPVGIFLKLSGNKYNTWTLIGAVAVVLGTLQQHILRNSIFAMIFLPLMILIWHVSTKNKNSKLLVIFPFIFLLWTYIHGYALIGLVLLLLFFIGEAVDQFFLKSERNHLFLLVFIIMLSVSWSIVSINWSLNPSGIVRNFIKTISSTLSSGENNNKNTIGGNNVQKQDEFKEDSTNNRSASEDSFNDVSKNSMTIFRLFLEGGDADIITEYDSPLDTTYALNVKVLIAFSFLYFIYLIIAIRNDKNGVRFSYILPSIATIYLGYGYQRTVAFPFLVALPLMAPHVKNIYNLLIIKMTNLRSFFINAIPWFGAMAYLCTASYFYAPINLYPFDFIGLKSVSIAIRKLVHDYALSLLILVYACFILYWLWIYIRKEKSIPHFSSIAIVSLLPGFSLFTLWGFKPISFFEKAIGFLFVYSIIPFILYGIRRMSSENQNRYFFRYNSLIFWGLPLLFLFQFGFATHALYKETNNLVITGMSDRQPGLGRNNYLSDTMPDYIYKKYKHEDMFNSYNIGSYLLWKWYPDKKVFIDSRSVDYTTDFYLDYMRNRSYKYFDIMKLDKAVLSILYDKEWYEDYLAQNWALLAFDNSMLLLKRRISKGYESSYGNVPIYIGNSEDIEKLPKIDRTRIGIFINDVLKYMLLFGRLADAAKWVDTIQLEVMHLTQEQRDNIIRKKKYILLLKENFGLINDPVLADTSRRLTKDYSPLSLNLAIGDAHRRLNNPKKAALSYFSAAQLAPNDVNIQRRIADRMFELKSLNLAILQYDKVLALDPNFIIGYHKLGYLYSMKGDYIKAEISLRQLLERAPMQKETYLNLAEVLQANGKIDQAINICKSGLEKLPGNIALKLKLDQLLGKQG